MESSSRGFHNPFGLERHCDLQEIFDNSNSNFDDVFEQSVFVVFSQLIVEGGSILLAFLAVGCMGFFMLYLVNGIYILSYILIQVLLGDGPSGNQKKSQTDQFLHLIYDQIFLYRFWKRSSPSGSPIKPKIIFVRKL